MKKKVIIIIATVLILILVGIGVFISKSSKNNKIEYSNNYSEHEEDIDLNGGFSKSEDTYDMDFLEKLDDLEELEGQIIDIKKAESDLYACTNNKVYRYELLRI